MFTEAFCIPHNSLPVFKMHFEVISLLLIFKNFSKTAVFDQNRPFLSMFVKSLKNAEADMSAYYVKMVGNSIIYNASMRFFGAFLIFEIFGMKTVAKTLIFENFQYQALPILL